MAAHRRIVRPGEPHERDTRNRAVRNLSRKFTATGPVPTIKMFSVSCGERMTTLNAKRHEELFRGTEIKRKKGAVPEP